MSTREVISLLSSDEELGEAAVNYSDFIAFSDDEDEQIHQAIALSLRETQAPPSKPTQKPVLYRNDLGVSSDTSTVIDFLSLLYRNNKGKKEQCTAALLSSFIADFDWIQKTIPKEIPITVIKHWQEGGGDKEGHFMIHSNFTVVHPPRNTGKYGCMHCKIYFICFPTALRVVISSANLRQEEWDCLDQSVWFEDFEVTNGGAVDCKFKSDLQHLLSKFGVSGNFLHQYDFSTTKAKLVMSIPGTFYGSMLNDYGHLRLNQIVRELQQQKPFTTGSILSCSSSVGKWTKEFVASCAGNSIESPELKILFPSASFVSSCRFPEGSGILHFPSSHLKNEEIMQHLCVWKSRENTRCVIPHYKYLCSLSPSKRLNWLYVGSHNLSLAAWGRCGKNNITISNYEVGVVLSASDFGLETSALPFLDDMEPFTREQPYCSS